MSASAFAIDESKPLHRSADKEIWDRKANRIELFGRAVVRQPGETLSADYIVVDMNKRTLEARGNCVYITADSVIYGEEMQFNLDTRTGTIIGGRVANERFTLAGERINKLGDGRFQTHWGEYTTCADCPESWEFQAEDVDMTFGGYAYMSNVTPKIKDAPAFWLPYLIIPLKTQRQTGFLPSRITFGGPHGLVFVQPFFWAINRSSDMTLGAGYYAARGIRGEWEGRYVLHGRSRGQANAFYVADREPNRPKIAGYGNLERRHRWGLNVAQIHELPFGIEQKLRVREASDMLYPVLFPEFGWNGDPYLSSDMSFAYGSPYFRGFIAGSRIRNLTPSRPPAEQLANESRDLPPGVVDPQHIDPDKFDPHTVQVLPAAVITTNDKFILGTPIAAGLTFGATNFTRIAGPTDDDIRQSTVTTRSGEVVPITSTLREATRVSISPSLYTTVRPFDVLSVVPSLQYRGYGYSFHNASIAGARVPNLYRQYLLFQTDLTTQLERIYENSNPSIPRTKHLIRPLISYSLIPFEQEPEHPFIRQTKAQAGYQFDNYDIVAINNDNQNYTLPPIGHSLGFGFTTELIRRHGRINSPSASYQRSLEFTSRQTVNLREFKEDRGEARRNQPRQPWSIFFSGLDAQVGNFVTSMSYYFHPYIPPRRHRLSTSFTYVLDRGLHQRILEFDRSVSVGYSYNQLGCAEYSNCGYSGMNGNIRFSLSDYVLPSLRGDYSFVYHNFQTAGLNLLFQSPSRCWRVSLDVAYTRNDRRSSWSPEVTLNLTGSGFTGVSEITNLTAQPR